MSAFIQTRSRRWPLRNAICNQCWTPNGTVRFFFGSRRFLPEARPFAAVEGVRMGRITALRKADGGVRGIVVGGILRRGVAKQMAIGSRETTFQCTLTTKVGCESVTHIFKSLTDQDERASIVSIDEVGAYDLISRNVLLEGLATVPKGDKLLPFVRHLLRIPVSTSGRMTRARHIGSLKAKGRNRATP